MDASTNARLPRSGPKAPRVREKHVVHVTVRRGNELIEEKQLQPGRGLVLWEKGDDVHTSLLAVHASAQGWRAVIPPRATGSATFPDIGEVSLDALRTVAHGGAIAVASDHDSAAAYRTGWPERNCCAIALMRGVRVDIEFAELSVTLEVERYDTISRRGESPMGLVAIIGCSAAVHVAVLVIAAAVGHALVPMAEDFPIGSADYRIVSARIGLATPEENDSFEPGDLYEQATLRPGGLWCLECEQGSKKRNRTPGRGKDVVSSASGSEGWGEPESNISGTFQEPRVPCLTGVPWLSYEMRLGLLEVELEPGSESWTRHSGYWYGEGGQLAPTEPPKAHATSCEPALERVGAHWLPTSYSTNPCAEALD